MGEGKISDDLAKIFANWLGIKRNKRFLLIDFDKICKISLKCKICGPTHSINSEQIFFSINPTIISDRSLQWIGENFGFSNSGNIGNRLNKERNLVLKLSSCE